MLQIFKSKNVQVWEGDAINFYDQWSTPVTIVSDGPYGVGGYPGDPFSADSLDEWYEPHIESWSKYSTPETTLWFWNTELGWANVHPILKKHGWEYKNCHTWDKGMAHVAGNVNGKKMRKLPVVTEVCVQYVKKATLPFEGVNYSVKDWLRLEWKRTRLPFSKTNEACEVKDAATRKYFTTCDLWYFPPVEAFEKLQKYANTYGKAEGRPYFSIDGKTPLTNNQWERLRAKFNFPYGVTNVWQEPAVKNQERLKVGQKALHLNQKPLKFMNLILQATSDEGDVVWEPFGGLCSAAVAASQLSRTCFAAEINPIVYSHAVKRLEASQKQKSFVKSDLESIDETLVCQNQLVLTKL